MSSRHSDYKGSSRSTRDDSRQSKEGRKEHDRRRSRSRSRSPRRRPSPPKSSKYSPTRSNSKYSHSEEKDRRKRESSRNHKRSYSGSSEEEVPAPPPPPRITPISIELPKPKGPIKMSLGGPAKPAVKKPLVASVFNNDDDEEPEEMPAEARMRMRNIGRETPTSAGPNSFGKTKQGFCDAKKVFEKNLKQALEPTEKSSVPKFPQTIYKIKGP